MLTKPILQRHFVPIGMLFGVEVQLILILDELETSIGMTDGFKVEFPCKLLFCVVEA